MKALSTALLALGLSLPLVAAATEAEQITVSHPWIRVLPGALPAGGYATLVNHGARPVALIGASSAAYGRVMLHQSTIVNGVSHMHMVQRLTVPAHGSVKLAPGGYHLMLMHPVAAVKPGRQVALTLRFADGSSRGVDFLARPANASDDRH